MRFSRDKDADAYEKVVDRLLRSKHFGERMAVHWLDIVRYADTAGYHSDNDRSVWLYRDWVIDAFNSNMPFREFAVEQIAGDLLPKATAEQKIASGHNRLVANDRRGRQPGEGIHREICRRPRAQFLDRLARSDAGLHRVPRSQVRSVHDQGVLQARRVLRRHPGSAGRPAGADADHDRRPARASEKARRANRGVAKANRAIVPKEEAKAAADEARGSAKAESGIHEDASVDADLDGRHAAHGPRAEARQLARRIGRNRDARTSPPLCRV